MDNLVHDGDPVWGTTETQLVEVLATAGAAHVDLVQTGDPAKVEGRGDTYTQLVEVLATAGAAKMDNHVNDGDPVGETGKGDIGLQAGGIT